MGRKTFESFPKPLPNRTHIVITNQKNYPKENCIIVNTIKQAIEIVKHQDKAYVIGGGEIYKQFMPFVDQIELTRVNGIFDADTFFPEIHLEEWTLQSKKHHPKDERHKYSFDYETYIKKIDV